MFASSAVGAMFTAPAVCVDDFEPQPDIRIATADTAAQSLRPVGKTLIITSSPFYDSYVPPMVIWPRVSSKFKKGILHLGICTGGIN